MCCLPKQCDSVEWDQMIGWQAHQDCLLQSCSGQACHQPRCYTVSSLLLLGLPSWVPAACLPCELGALAGLGNCIHAGASKRFMPGFQHAAPQTSKQALPVAVQRLPSQQVCSSFRRIGLLIGLKCARLQLQAICLCFNWEWCQAHLCWLQVETLHYRFKQHALAAGLEAANAEKLQVEAQQVSPKNEGKWMVAASKAAASKARCGIWLHQHSKAAGRGAAGEP